MADNTIDSLVLEISSNSKGAEKALDKLSISLQKMSNSLGGMNTAKFMYISKGIREMSSSLAGFSSNVKLADFNRVSNGLNKIAAIDAAGVRSTAVAMNGLMKSLNNLTFLNFDIKGITDVANGIAKLGRGTVTQAATNIPALTQSLKGLANGIKGLKIDFDISGLTQLTTAIQKLGSKSATKAAESNIIALGNALREMMAVLSKAPTVSQNVIQMTNALAQLAMAGGRAGTASRSLVSSFNTLPASASKAHKSFSGLAGAIGKFYATYWIFLRAMGGFKKAIDISSELTEVQNVVDVTFGEMADTMNEFADSALQNYGMSELMAKQIASRFQAMGVSMGFAQGKMSEMSIELTKLTGDMASFYNESQESVAKALQSIFTGETEPMRRFGLDLSFATVEAWALSQGLDADMQSMTQAEKTMLRYQYVLANTGAASGDFLRTINSWHNQLVLLAGGFQQLGSIVGGVLINAFKPFIQALNSVMGAVINFAQVVSDALGAIFGWEYQTGGGVAQDLEMGAGAAQDIEDATGGAADNAKKLNKYIAGWHEVNNMTSNKDSGGTGGGGGAGGGGLADADGGKWVKGESILDAYKSEIDTLFELGEYVRDTLIKAMESIKWDEVYEKMRGFGKGLADFLNGLLSYDGEGHTLFGEIGKTLANTLNAIVYSAQSFATTFNFEQLGINIADGINNLFRNFDFASLANTIDTWVQGIWTTIKTAVQKIEWKTIWDGITDFISEIDLETISIIIGAVTIKKIGKFIFGGALLKELAATFGVRLAAELGTAPVITTLTAGIKALFGSAAAKSSLVFMFPGAASIVSGVSTWVTGTLLPALSGFGSMIASAISGPWGLAIAAALAGVFAIITNWDVVYAFFTETLPSFWNSTAVPFFGEMFSPLGQAYEKHMKPLIDSISNGFSSIYKKFKDGYNEHMKPVLDDLGEKFSIVWDGIITPILENAQELFGNIGELFSTVWETDFQPSLKLLGDAFGIVADAINIFWKEVLQPCIEWIADNFWPMVSPAVEAVGNIFISVFEQIGKTIDGFMTILNGIITFITGVFSGDWSKAWEGVKTVFKGVWDAMPDFIKGPIKLIIGFVNSMIGAIENGINFVVRGMNNLQFDVPDWVPGIGGETFGFDLNEIRLPRIPQLARGGVLEKGQVGLLEGNGAEAVVPLEKNTRWISRVAATMSDEFGKYRLNTFVPKQSLSSNSYNHDKLKFAMQMERDSRMAQQQYEVKRQNQLLEKLISVVEQKELHIGDDDIFNATRRGQNRFAKRTFKTGWAGID